MATNLTNVLLIGSGGREHALAWKLSKSSQIGNIFVAPGNGGTGSVNKTKCCAINFPASPSNDYSEVVKFCKENHINLVVVGPEEHLARGVADALSDANILCFGPKSAAAKIESSKAFAKEFMRRHEIPTACYETFTSSEAAVKYIKSANYAALVVKASGLAAGKGVTVAKNVEEACHVAIDMLDNKKFGDAGSEIVVEEILEGEEISALAFTDGTTVKMMPLARDHKRLNDNDQGPNTGGMGAYAPCCVDPKLCHFIEKEILLKTIEKLKAEGVVFRGVLYAGLMLTNEGPKVLEFNCRFGDPETQALLPLLKSDLVDVLFSCVRGNLNCCDVEWYSNKTACGIVMASGGYPENFEKGLEISGLGEAAKAPNVVIYHAGTVKNNEGNFLTSGGRVLCVVGVGSDVAEARSYASSALSLIHFKNCHYRNDIGAERVVNHFNHEFEKVTYASSGVNIDAGDHLVREIKSVCEKTLRPGSSCFEFGGFGGLFDLKEAGYDDPILVSGTDGVGTKLKIAQEINDHSTIGVDLVAMCVNDILVHDAEPLFFLDYYATGKLNVANAAFVIGGVADGCKQAGCILIGGETAEMPGFYTSSEYDLAGFAVGALNRNQPKLPQLEKICEGDVVFGLASSGLHSNGFSLVRKIVENVAQLKYTDVCPWNKSNTVGFELLKPTKIYVKSLLKLLRTGQINAAAHITGGGLLENIPRVLPSHLAVNLDARKWTIPDVFKWILSVGRVEPTEMFRTFNCGVGMVLIVPSCYSEEIFRKLNEVGETVFNIGDVVQKTEGRNVVEIAHYEEVFQFISLPFFISEQPKIRVAVLISGTGTNLQSLIDHTKDRFKNSRCSIEIVISNVNGVKGLKRAQDANIPTKVISHKNKSRETFDDEVDSELRKYSVEIVCLAGFMRILSEKFVRSWRGRLLNIHPSLLPSFKGAHAHKLALEAGVRVSGCTVHFVEPEVDAGGIILQETVAVYPNDDVDALSERVKSVEHLVYPKAMECVATGQVRLNDDGKVIWT